MKTKPTKDPIGALIEAVILSRTPKDKSDYAALMRLRTMAQKTLAARSKISSEINRQLDDVDEYLISHRPKLDPKPFDVDQVYFKNGRIAKNGDKVLSCENGQTGIIYNLNSKTGFGQLAALDSSFRFVCASNCVLVTDLTMKPIDNRVGLACSNDPNICVASSVNPPD